MGHGKDTDDLSQDNHYLGKKKLLVEANVPWASFLEFCLVCENILPITLFYLKLRYLQFHSLWALLACGLIKYMDNFTFFYYQWFYSSFVGLGSFFQFPDPTHNGWDSLDGGSAIRNAFRYTQNNINTEWTHSYIHAWSWIRSHDLSVSAGKGSSCLRPFGHCDRQTLPFILSYSGFPWVYETTFIIGVCILLRLPPNNVWHPD
jgi:hypothetical protein